MTKLEELLRNKEECIRQLRLNESMRFENSASGYMTINAYRVAETDPIVQEIISLLYLRSVGTQKELDAINAKIAAINELLGE